MPNVFDKFEADMALENKQSDEESQVPVQRTGNVFDQMEADIEAETKQEDSKIKSALRTIYQIPGGLAKRYTFPLDVITFISTGLGNDPEFIDRVSKNAEQLGIPFNEEEFLQGIEEQQRVFQENFPTQSNTEKFIEDTTEAPLEPKTKAQELLHFGSEAAGFKSGGPKKKLAAGVIAPSTSETLQQFGVPKEPADFIGFILSQLGTEAIAKYKQALKGKSPTGLEQKALDAAPGGEPPPPGIPGVGPSPEPTPPGSTFKTQEAVADILKGSEAIAAEQTKPLGGIAPKPIQQATGDLVGRDITKSNKSLGISPTREPSRPARDLNITPSRRMARQINPEKIENKAIAGRSIKDAIMAVDEVEYQIVNDLYEESRLLNEGISEIQPEMVSNLQEQARQIERIPHPSRIENQKLSTIRDILERAATFDENGNVTGYLEINNQDMISQIQSVRRTIDFDFSHNGASGIFRPVTQALDEAVIRTAERVNNPEAVTALTTARNAYREWTQTFNNKEIVPYRDSSNRQFRKLFETAEDLDNFPLVEEILSRHSTGDQLANATRREIVEKQMSKYIDNPKKFKPSQFEDQLREIEPILQGNQAEIIRNEYSRGRSATVFKRSEAHLKQAAKAMESTPEGVNKLMKTRSGIKDLRGKLTKVEGGEKIFNDLQQDKIRDIFRGGNVKQKLSGDEVFKILNKRENFELLVEMTSEKEVLDILNLAEEAGGKSFTKDLLKKAGNRFLTYKIVTAFL